MAAAMKIINTPWAAEIDKRYMNSSKQITRYTRTLSAVMIGEILWAAVIIYSTTFVIISYTAQGLATDAWSPTGSVSLYSRSLD